MMKTMMMTLIYNDDNDYVNKDGDIDYDNYDGDNDDTDEGANDDTAHLAIRTAVGTE